VSPISSDILHRSNWRLNTYVQVNERTGQVRDKTKSRRLFFSLRAGMLSVVVAGLTILAAAEPKNVVIRGGARFEVLSQSVFRMEYSHDRKFVDAPSVAVQNRNWGAPEFHTADSGGWLEISTRKMKLRYRLGSGAFAPENLLISWSDEQGGHHWKPGDKDDRNLGGVPGDIAARAVAGTEPGPLSRNGYYLFDDSRTTVWNSAGDWVEPRGSDKSSQDWYFFVYSRDFKGFLREMTELLGPIPMIPRYVLGTWFGSRAGYSEDEWKRIIYRFHEEHVPLDMIVLDSDSSVKYTWGGRDWDLEQMPDPFAFFKYAKTQGVRVTVNEHYEALTPQNCSNFESIRTAMGLPATTKDIPLDLANKKFAKQYVDLFLKPALQAGMAFWWQDGNAKADMEGQDPVLWTRYVEYTGSEQSSGRRGFVFSRIGTPPWNGYRKEAVQPAWGVHRYGAFFTGDLVPHWSTLDLLVPFNVQAGNMLVDYVNNLTGGVDKLVLDTELYLRWVQFSAMSPIFWWHGIWGLRMPWEYGAEALETTRKFLQLRYSLIPYLYTYSRLAHDDGQPLVRGTYIEYPAQEGAYEFRHQYLLGKELLVAPVSEPGFGKPVLKEIYLPAGEEWFDFFTGKIYEGGQLLAYECPLDRMPIFVKAGSILPLAPPMEYSDQRALDPLTLDVFAGKAASFQLYEDDGTSLDYRKNEFSRTPLSYQPSQQAGQHTITIGPTEGHYQGQPESRRYKVRIHGLLKPAAVRAGDQTLPEKQDSESGKGWIWNDQDRVTTVDLPTNAPIQSGIVVTLQDAGSFASEKLLEKVVNYRTRVRQIEVAEKRKWGMLLRGQDLKKEPFVLRETERVEQELNDLIDSPQRLASSGVDFKSWTSHILTAFVNHPFESNRGIPEVDPDALKATRMIENAVFTTEEISEMTAELLGCTLRASATGNPSPDVTGRLDYDSDSLPGAQVSYELSLPRDNPPGWGEISRSLDDQRFIHFEVQAPFPPQPGGHLMQLRAILKWEGGQIEMTRDIEWVSSGDTGS
jgi:alpha-glucosidase (family GH31 glycosyl hydrolase)